MIKRLSIRKKRAATFTEEMLNVMRQKFSKVQENLDTNSETYRKFVDYVKGLPNDTLTQIMNAKIRLLSNLAGNQAVERGLV